MAGSPRARKALQGVLVGLAAGALALGLAIPGLLDAFEGRTWDWRVRLLARPGAATDHIALIVLDQASLDWGQEVNGLVLALAAGDLRRGGGFLPAGRGQGAGLRRAVHGALRLRGLRRPGLRQRPWPRTAGWPAPWF